MTKNDYITSWHDLFVQNVNCALGFIAGKMVSKDLSLECREKLSIAKAFLEGKDVCDVERDLAHLTINDETFEKTERIYIEIIDFFIDMTIKDEETKQVMKNLARMFEHYRKEATRLQLNYFSAQQ